ncbi:MAG: biotin--[Bacteroidales bacterium]|nr:biotin--[acetyl-CoA-carboxylase] ligase [Bacteroidales bacterium]
MDKKLDIKWYNSIDSTNLQAERELSSANEGSVWIADYQTAGRGQRGNVWESAKGVNLMFTLLLRPLFLNAQDQFLISQISALAIVNYLKTKGLDAKIKWPNDIYTGDRKICGILISHTVTGANLSASIIGVGLNVNQTRFDSDAPNPTSMLLESNGLLPGDYTNLECYDRKEELPKVLVEFMALYDLLESGDYEQIRELYHKNMYRTDGYYKFLNLSGRGDENIFEAKIIGPDSYGCLILEKRDGSREHYAFQEVRYIL